MSRVIDTLNFDYEAHRYSVNGRTIPSVTQLLKAYGLIDISMVPSGRLEFKRALGVALHYAAELHVQNDLDYDSLDKRIRPYFDAYLKFCEVYKFEPAHSEHRMYSKRYGFAGTLDLQGVFQGIVTWKDKPIQSIIDLKCTWTMYPSTGPQTAAYALLYEETYGVKIKGRFGVQLKSTGDFEIHQFNNPSDLPIFLSCINLHNWRRKHHLLPKEEMENGN